MLQVVCIVLFIFMLFILFFTCEDSIITYFVSYATIMKSKFI